MRRREARCDSCDEHQKLKSPKFIPSNQFVIHVFSLLDGFIRNETHQSFKTGLFENNDLPSQYNKLNDAVFLASVQMYITKCTKKDDFSWSGLTNSMKTPKEILVSKMKEIRGEARLFMEFLKENNVAFNHNTGIVTIPSFLWRDPIMNSKYHDSFSTEKNYSNLHAWGSIFEKNIIPLDDEARPGCTKRKAKGVVPESSKRSKSSIDVESMEINRPHEVDQCDEIFDDMMNKKLITALGHYELHSKVLKGREASYFLNRNEECQRCFVEQTLIEVASTKNKDISLYLIEKQVLQDETVWRDIFSQYDPYGNVMLPDSVMETPEHMQT